MAELGLYIHLPFCPSRCPYCDFTAQVFAPGLARGLLEDLAWHLRREAPRAGGRPLASVYLGGGTPSLWPAAALSGLLDAVRANLDLEPAAEISLEANPGTLSAGKLDRLAAAGFNRLSLGAQTFHAPLLTRLGRRHTPADTRRAAAQARRAGFGNLSLDLIYGLPGQSLEQFRLDLDEALALEPEHLSLYELTLGPDTPWGRQMKRGRPPLPSEAEVLAMEDAAEGALAAAGLERYEVSNFARPGRACRHNQATWRGEDYLGLGPGAHGHLSGVRWAWTGDVAAYRAALAWGEDPPAWREDLTPAQRALELVMLGLRTTAGVDLAALGRVLGADPREYFAEALDLASLQGWVVVTQNRILPTSPGLRFADRAAGLFADACDD
ncbi:MAG: radical SAM family heme chaperone HemW [Deltaproteobacteria bacterium]|nr:radical SAM family heme chaperone HemW [Deltaproteobacteria bacterium]